MEKRASSRTQVASWRAKRAHALHGPCSTAAETKFSSWGTKGARTAPNDLIRAAGLRRDWANLADGPAWLISERVLADDVADYVRFRAVCRAWRQCATDPRDHSALDRRFHPRRWFMLCDEKLPPSAPHRRRFLNVATGQCVEMDLPADELRNHCAFGPTAEGLLVLVVRVLNPFTRQLTALPSMATLLPRNRFRKCLFSRKGFKTCYARDLSGGDLTVDGAGLADDSTLALYFGDTETLAVAMPGDERWTLVDRHDTRFVSVSSFAGRFYCVASHAVMVVKTAENQPPELVVAAEARMARPYSLLMLHTLHLVESGRELMLVHRYFSGDGHKRKYDVHRVDLEAGKTVPVRGLNGHAVFIGVSRALSVSPEVFPSISADAIYPGFEFNERTSDYSKTDAYHLADGSIEPSVSSYDTSRGLEIARPYRIADCLSLHIKGYRDYYGEPKSCRTCCGSRRK